MAQFGSDAFTDTAGVGLAAHTPTGGGTWTEHASDNAGNIVISDANRARSSSGNTTLFYHSGTPATAEYDVSSDIHVFTTAVTSHQPGIAGRIDTAAATYYAIRKTTSTTTQFQLIKNVAGSVTVLASFTP